MFGLLLSIELIRDDPTFIYKEEPKAATFLEETTGKLWKLENPKDQNSRKIQQDAQFLKVFTDKEEGWLKLFCFIYRYVSQIRGETNFDNDVLAILDANEEGGDFMKVCTVSDIAFCINSMDNGEDCWKEISDYGYKVKDIPKDVTKKGGKYTKDKNESKGLRDAYKAVNYKVQNSVQKLHQDNLLKDFNREFFKYMKAQIDKKHADKSTSGEGKPSKKSKIVHLEDDPDADGANFELFLCYAPPTTSEIVQEAEL